MKEVDLHEEIGIYKLINQYTDLLQMLQVDHQRAFLANLADSTFADCFILLEFTWGGRSRERESVREMIFG